MPDFEAHGQVISFLSTWLFFQQVRSGVKSNWVAAISYSKGFFSSGDWTQVFSAPCIEEDSYHT